jgi:hypothetical protein
VLEGSCSARHRRGSAHRPATDRRALLVAALWAIELSSGSSFTPINSRRDSTTAYSIAFCNSRTLPGQCNRVISEKHPAQWLVQVCRVLCKLPQKHRDQRRDILLALPSGGTSI